MHVWHAGVWLLRGCVTAWCVLRGPTCTHLPLWRCTVSLVLRGAVGSPYHLRGWLWCCGAVVLWCCAVLCCGAVALCYDGCTLFAGIFILIV